MALDERSQLGTWSLAQYLLGADQRTGVLRGNDVFALPDELGKLSLLDLLDDWDTHAPQLRGVDQAELVPVPSATLIAPLTYPRKVLCAGANYYGHAEEMGTARPDPSAQPFFFLKPPTTTVVSASADVTLPPDADVDWEVELAVVIGRGGRHIDESAALAHVAGYAVANDLSARGLFPRSDAVFPAFGWDWLAHKGFDGFCPLGPGVVPAWLVPDPQALRMRLSVNEVVKQDESTADMVITVPRLIAGASRVTTLEPGDVILTGTPAGVGMPRKTFLHAGDLVVAEIEGFGRLVNRMVGT